MKQTKIFGALAALVLLTSGCVTTIRPTVWVGEPYPYRVEPVQVYYNTWPAPVYMHDDSHWQRRHSYPHCW